MSGALGWNEEASEAAIRQCNGNVTSAVEMLEREETAMLEQFESAVKDMVCLLIADMHILHPTYNCVITYIMLGQFDCAD